MKWIKRHVNCESEYKDDFNNARMIGNVMNLKPLGNVTYLFSTLIFVLLLLYTFIILFYI